ncbi:hypothetical protein A9W99_15880 [Mycobacterium sp. 1164966.3]|nr:hypothetical protein A9W99_15880 [Mycobacterium sp. 1164966.3]
MTTQDAVHGRPGGRTFWTLIAEAAARQPNRPLLNDDHLKGPQCFLGYADAALDADAFDSEGWLRTGDLGLIDANGNVHVTGRIKDAIIRNAENVSALEVENVLIAHPAVADVAVIGVPDRGSGERVCAVVVPHSADGVSLNPWRNTAVRGG